MYLGIFFLSLLSILSQPLFNLPESFERLPLEGPLEPFQG